MAKVLEHKSTNIDQDTEAFRLRRFIEWLVQVDAAEIRDEPTDLIDIADALDGSAKAVWFRRAGPEDAELVGNVNGSREWLAMAFDSCNGRKVAMALDEVRRSGGLDRTADGEYRLAGTPASKG